MNYRDCERCKHFNLCKNKESYIMTIGEIGDSPYRFGGNIKVTVDCRDYDDVEYGKDSGRYE